MPEIASPVITARFYYNLHFVNVTIDSNLARPLSFLEYKKVIIRLNSTCAAAREWFMEVGSVMKSYANIMYGTWGSFASSQVFHNIALSLSLFSPSIVSTGNFITS